jgi:5'-3' exonuclease
VINADRVIAKFGVPAESIPDQLAQVGDSADGFPGLPGLGFKSAATLLARYVHLQGIPTEATDWHVTVRGALPEGRRRSAQCTSEGLKSRRGHYPTNDVRLVPPIVKLLTITGLTQPFDLDAACDAVGVEP